MLETITAVLVMLIAVVISGPVTRMLPIGVPLPLVQIALGTAIAASFDFEVVLEPEIFFLLFITPLLFLDGWRIPKQGLFRDAATILELSVGLVIFTVLGMGYFIHWLLPTMPLPVAFALAAILSPTDPVAVSAITSRSPAPKRVMHILEGESLLNDASGLVCMRFAIAAALTGAFSLSAAVASFLWLAVGGIAIGAALSWLVNQLKSRISKRFGEETGTQILVSLLIPFGAYLLAEHLGCSGILAAVAAGVTMSYAEFTGMAGGETGCSGTPSGTRSSSPPTASSSCFWENSCRPSCPKRPKRCAKPGRSRSGCWPSTWSRSPPPWLCCASSGSGPRFA